MLMRDIMTPGVETIPSTESVVHAANRMKSLNVGSIPVTENSKPVGIVTDRDITVRTVAEQLNPANISVGEIMTKNPVSCAEDTEIREAVRIMEEKQVRRLLVENEEGNITGIVSLGDLAVNVNKETAGDVVKEVSKPAEPQR